ncbi:MAG: glycerophosphoryl diester phosphodiesterase membrane domain-containing protein [Actinomycetota bacterium]|nr:glycerophosphoryl diester phosphodiesterase membrane domain-containing protein [Actinomycetota bacterium]
MDAAQLRPLSVGEMLDLGIKIYRQRFVPMVKAVAAVVAPVSVITALVQLSLEPDSEDLFGPVDATGQPTVDGGEFFSFLAGALAAGLLGYVAAQLATAASYKLVAGAYLDDPPDWRASLSAALARLGSLVWLTIVFAFLLVLGFLACVVPGIFLYVAWSVAVPALLLEDQRGWQALKRSKQLVKGRWWPVLGAIVVSGILAGIVQAVFSGLLIAIAGAGDNAVVDATATAIANTAASVLTTPFSAAVIMVVYFDLRVRKEGFDLELLARRVGVEPPAGSGGAEGGSAGDWSSAESEPRTSPGSSEPPFWPPPPGWRPDG